MSGLILYYHLYCNELAILVLISQMCIIQLEQPIVISIRDFTYSKVLTKMIKGKDKTEEGDNSTYYQISSTKGIKILDGNYDTYQAVLMDDMLISAKKEAELMKLAKTKYQYVPICYGVKIVQFKNYFKIGIIMQHLGNIMIQSLETFKRQDIDGFKNKINKLSICHKDIHGKNIMVYKGQYWLIDFDPSFVEIV